MTDDKPFLMGAHAGEFIPADDGNLMNFTIPKAQAKCNFARHTTARPNLRWVGLICLLALWFVSLRPLHAQGDLSQPHYYLVPATSTTIRLHTHTADMELGYDGAALVASVNALYRLQNTGAQPVSLTLNLVADIATENATSSPTAADALPVRLPDNLVVLVNQQPLPITQADDGSPATQVQVQAPAGATLDVRLSYALDLGDGPLAGLAYSPRPLRQWPGEPSLRVSMATIEASPSESWLGIQPEGWSYAPGANTTPRIRWLYDAPLPTQAFRFHFVHPGAWRALVEATAAATPGAPVSEFLRLGRLYGALHDAALDEAQRDRFYAQAVAAFTAGLDAATTSSAPSEAVATLHAELAARYRTRSVSAAGAVDRVYMDLLAAEAEQALAGLPVGDPQRSELLQWQVEGLTLQLNDARDRRDWPAAFAALEQLATLPPDAVDASTLRETQRALTVQQALQLLEEGDSEAAMHLVGAQVGDLDLMPPTNARPIFATWQVTVTIAPTQMNLVFAVRAASGREEDALSALTTLAQTWQTAREAGPTPVVTGPMLASQGHEDDVLLMTLSLPPNTGAAALARITPPGADWALARTLLAQLAPRIERETQLLSQQIVVAQPLDLRSTREQWLSVAATLEQQAGQFEAQSPNINLAVVDALAAESALLTRIRAANYRAAALTWRTLARNSLVAVQLSAGAGVPPVTRTWVATPETELQVLTLTADVVSLGRLVAVVAMALAGLFLLAGALWWLL